MKKIRGFNRNAVGRERREAIPGLIPKSAYGRVLDQVFSSALEENREFERRRATVPELLAALMGLTLNQQKLLVQNSPRYHDWALAEELLIRSRAGWTEDPLHSERLAELALEVSDHLTVFGYRAKLLNDLRAEAWSYIGNCRRIRSDLYSSARAFDTAGRLLEEGSGDLLDRARFLDLKSSLLRAQRNFKQAAELLATAINAYRQAGDRHMEGRALLKKAKLLRDSGSVAETIPVMERAATLLDRNREPYLLFLLKKDLVLHLSEIGRAGEAQRLLPEVKDLSRQYGTKLERLRLLWVEGTMRKNLRQFELAAEALRQVREGFLAARIGYDVALVSLDLAAIYLETHRTEEARQLATESIPLFTSRGVHREALMAWNLFREAAERDALTLGLVQEVASRIRQSQSHPAAGGDLA